MDLNINLNDSIYSVLGKMETKIFHFEQSKNLYIHLPFLKTYFLVTRAVAARYDKKSYFNDLKQIEKLDVYFASLCYTTITPWQSYFKYCQRQNGYAFVRLLLGINAHINADLYQAINDLPYRQKNDFEKVNEILLEQIPQVMLNLVLDDKDIFGVAGVLLNDFMVYEFNQVVVRWRQEAWRGSLPLSMVQKNTDLVGERIINIFDHIFDPKNPLETLKTINKLSIYA